MPNLIQFLNGAFGRFLRVLAMVGLVPIGLGVWGRCLLELVSPKTTGAV